MRAILPAPTLEDEMVLLVASDGEHQSALLCAGQRDSHESGPTLRGSNPHSWSLITRLVTPSRTIASLLPVRLGTKNGFL